MKQKKAIFFSEKGKKGMKPNAAGVAEYLAGNAKDL